MDERSPDGTVMMRHEIPDDVVELARPDPFYREVVNRHLGAALGVEPTVFHEIVSEGVQLDVLVYSPTLERPYVVLASCGLSDLPMHVPPELEAQSVEQGAGSLKRAELLLALPPHWPVDQKAFEDERNYWPVRLLKFAARLPHVFQTWLGVGHTIPNGNPPEPYAPDVEFVGVAVLPPMLPHLAHLYEVSEVPELRFYALVPLTASELELKLNHGLNALYHHLDDVGVSELVDPKRKDHAK